MSRIEFEHAKLQQNELLRVSQLINFHQENIRIVMTIILNDTRKKEMTEVNINLIT